MMSFRFQVPGSTSRVSNSGKVSAPPFQPAPALAFWCRTPLATRNFELGTLLACAACFGKSDSPLANGMNWGIFTLLGVVVPVLSCFAFCFIRMINKDESSEKNKNAPENITDV